MEKHLVEAIKQRPYGVNIGLVFEKYAKFWKGKDIDISIDDELRKQFYEDLIKLMKQADRAAKFIREYNTRLDKIVESRGGRAIKLDTNWRFITGLGGPHPSETGFRWDRNLGMPYLSGSSIKGALRAWMTITGKETAEIDSLLGSTDMSGSVVFFDAIPNAKPSIEMDILNPHYSDYYMDPHKKKPPADYYSPVPVFFLTVAPGTQFIFRLIATDKSVDLGKVEEYLKSTANDMGFGAKTAVGYGQFIEPT